jgi:hypothetical protein
MFNKKIADIKYMLVYGNYPYPSEHFRKIIAKYQVAYIVTDSLHLDKYLNQILKQSDEFTHSVELFQESPSLLIYKVL